MEITIWTQTDQQNSKLKEYQEIIRIELLTDKYPTQRGLKVGDTEERLLDLYDNDNLMNYFIVNTYDGKVTNIILRSLSRRL